MAVVQRSQLDTPSVSPQPQAMRKKKANRKATTPANTESQRRAVELIAHIMDGQAALDVPLCVVFWTERYRRGSVVLRLIGSNVPHRLRVRVEVFDIAIFCVLQ